MMFPSLLYKEAPKTRPLSSSLFEDLQLTQLVQGCDFSCALCPVDADEVLYRREMFRALSDCSYRRHLSALQEILLRISELHTALENAACDAEKQVIYAFLMSATMEFSTLAAKGDAEGFLQKRFSDFFRSHTASDSFENLKRETKDLTERFGNICKYRFRYDAKRLIIEKSEEESYLCRILRCADRLGFSSPEITPMRARALSPEVIDAFAHLHPDDFSAFASYYEAHGTLFQKEILDYIGQIAFYLSMAQLFDRVRENGIPLVEPTVSADRQMHVSQAYDISLLAKNEKHIVPNDIDFDADAPFFFLTGANGGGKTTYLRTVGIAATLLLLGAPIPAKSATTYLPSAVFTHFPRDERFDGSGRFMEEHRRVEQILKEADENALILLNETYATTNEENALRMTEELASKVYRRGNFGLYITHQHGLSLTEIPYLNVLLDTDDNNRRTFKIARQKNSGGSYAEDILKKYALTKEDLITRFGGDR